MQLSGGGVVNLLAAANLDYAQIECVLDIFGYELLGRPPS